MHKGNGRKTPEIGIAMSFFTQPRSKAFVDGGAFCFERSFIFRSSLRGAA